MSAPGEQRRQRRGVSDLRTARRFSWPYYGAAAALALLGLLAGAVLLPGERELALISFKGRDFEGARRAFEAQVSAERLPASVIVPLAEVYLYFGDVELAVDLLERYLRANPESVEARRRLIGVYEQAQRRAEQLAMLEALERRAPNIALMRDIVESHRYWNDDAALEAALARLIERYPAKADEVAVLAGLMAARGDGAGALAVLAKRAPQGLDYDGIELMASLLLDLGRGEDAAGAAKEYLSRNADDAGIAALASLFQARDRAGFALTLLAPFEDRLERSEIIFAEWVSAMRATDQAREAYARIGVQGAARPLSLRVLRLQIELAAELGDFDGAYKAFEQAAGGDIDLATAHAVIDLGLAMRDPVRAQRVAEKLGAEAFAGRPMLAARLGFARGDRADGETWVRRAEATPALAANERLALAEHYADTDHNAAARDIARQLIGRADLAPEDLVVAAGVLARAGPAAGDVAVFDRLRRARPGPKTELGWALVASAAGQGETVRTWLAEAARKAQGPVQLAELYTVARQAKFHAEALELARRGATAAPGTEANLRLAEALVAAGQPIEGLAIARTLPPGTREAQAVFFAALARAYAKGAPVRDELIEVAKRRMAEPGLTVDERAGVAFVLVEAGAGEIALPMLAELARTGENWFYAYVDAATKAKRRDLLLAFLKSEIARTNLTDKQREARIYALLEQGGYGEALPVLQGLAETRGGDWLFAFEDAARKTGKEGLYLDLIQRRAERADVPRAERRDAAFRLLSSGRKPGAERIFVSLAEGAVPDGQEIEQLLYLWGPRPPKAGLDWLEARARAAPVAERGGWFDRLANVSAFERISRLAEQSGIETLDGPGFLAYAQALAAQRKIDALARAIEGRLKREDDPQRLKRLGRLSADFGLFAQAVPAYKKALVLLPDDREALRDGGISAASDQRYGEARPLLLRFHKLYPGDYESHLALGDAHAAAGERAAAQFHWGRTVTLVEADPKAAFFMKVLRAAALQRMDRTAEAIAAFEALRAERPNDADLRVDLAETLLKSKNFDRVRALVAKP